MEQRKDIPAFPSISEWQADSRGQAANTGHRVTKATEGMTLRDYFAAKAMQGYFAAPYTIHQVDADSVARYCYEMADAMLAAREK